MKAHEIHYYFALVVLALAFCLLSYIGYSMFYPFDPIDVKHPLKILTPIVEVGTYLEYEIDYCKYLDWNAKVTKTLHNDVIITLSKSRTNVEVGCKIAQSMVYIPKHIPPGIYYLRWEANYKHSVFRSINEVYETEKFEVIK